jgi:hypothetical protein
MARMYFPGFFALLLSLEQYLGAEEKELQIILISWTVI